LDEKGEREKDRKTVTVTMRKRGETRRLFSIYFFNSLKRKARKDLDYQNEKKSDKHKITH
jgi:hypothetical protein